MILDIPVEHRRIPLDVARLHHQIESNDNYIYSTSVKAPRNIIVAQHQIDRWRESIQRMHDIYPWLTDELIQEGRKYI